MALEENPSTNGELNLPNEKQVRKELGFEDNSSFHEGIEKAADKYLDQLLSNDIDELSKRKAVDAMGAKVQLEVANLSKMLAEPIKKLARSGEDGSSVSTALVNLKDEVEKLDPMKFDLTSAPGFFERIAKYIPFIGDRISRYFQRYMTADEVISRIVDSLEQGRDQLNRDNITLSQDKERMVSGLNNLERSIELGKILDQKLQYKLDRDFQNDSEKSSFIQNELLFPLRQRIMDLQQSLSVTQQGILTIEMIVRNNQELVRGVGRALNVTVSALQIAVASALALANQKITIKKLDAINSTTSKLIEQNAKRLKTQGVEIQKQAAESMLDIKSLERAFQDVKTALNDVAKYKQKALPIMRQNIKQMDELNAGAVDLIENIKDVDLLQGDAPLELDI